MPSAHRNHLGLLATYLPNIPNTGLSQQIPTNHYFPPRYLLNIHIKTKSYADEFSLEIPDHSESGERGREISPDLLQVRLEVFPIHDGLEIAL